MSLAELYAGFPELYTGIADTFASARDLSGLIWALPNTSNLRPAGGRGADAGSDKSHAHTGADTSAHTAASAVAARALHWRRFLPTLRAICDMRYHVHRRKFNFSWLRKSYAIGKYSQYSVLRLEELELVAPAQLAQIHTVRVDLRAPSPALRHRRVIEQSGRYTRIYRANRNGLMIYRVYPDHYTYSRYWSCKYTREYYLSDVMFEMQTAELDVDTLWGLGMASYDVVMSIYEIRRRILGYAQRS